MPQTAILFLTQSERIRNSYLYMRQTVASTPWPESEISLRHISKGFRAFTGRTKQGIRLGAMRKEIEKVYGLPSKVRGPQGKPFALIYQRKGLGFILDDGRLTGIQAWKPDNN